MLWLLPLQKWYQCMQSWKYIMWEFMSLFIYFMTSMPSFCMYALVLSHIVYWQQQWLQYLGTQQGGYFAANCLFYLICHSQSHCFSATKGNSLKEEWIAYVCREILWVSIGDVLLPVYCVWSCELTSLDLSRKFGLTLILCIWSCVRNDIEWIVLCVTKFWRVI